MVFGVHLGHHLVSRWTMLDLGIGAALSQFVIDNLGQECFQLMVSRGVNFGGSSWEPVVHPIGCSSLNNPQYMVIQGNPM